MNPGEQGSPSRARLLAAAVALAAILASAAFVLWRCGVIPGSGSDRGGSGSSSVSDLPGSSSRPASGDGSKIPDIQPPSKAERLAPSMDGIPASLCPGLRRWLALLRHEDKYVRRQAMEVLAWAVGPQDADAVPMILEAMRSDDMALRRWCAKALGRIGQGGEEAVTLAVEALRAFDGRWEAEDIVEGLGGFGKGSAAAVLAIVEWHPESSSEKDVQAIERISPGAVGAIPRLMEMLRDHRKFGFYRVFNALDGIGPSAVPAMLDCMDSCDLTSRTRILVLLGRYGPAAGEAVPAIRKILAEEPDRQWRSRFPFSDRLFKEDPDFELRCEFWASQDRGAALSTLGEIGPAAASALPEILGAWRGTRDQDAWAAMIKVNPRSSRVVETLVAMLKKGELDGIPPPESPKGSAKDPADEVLRIVRERAVAEIAEGRARSFALRTLGLLGSRAGEAVPAIVAAMEADPKLKDSALETLAWIGPDSAGAAPGIVADLPRSRREIREGCDYERLLGTLRAIGPKAVETYPALHAALEAILMCESDETEYMDRDVWMTLADVAPETEGAMKGAAFFIPAREEEERDRETIVKARKMLERPAAVSALMATPWTEPTGEYEMAGELAAGFLACIGSPAIPALVQALGSQDWKRRSQAARALGRMHPRSPEAEAALKPLLNDEEPWVRVEAARALGWMSEDPAEAVAVLEREFKTEDERRRREASLALAEIGPVARTAIPVLLETLKIEKGPGNGSWSDEEGSARCDAARALSRIGWESDAAIRALVAAMSFDIGHHAGPEPAARALEKAGSRAIPELLRALKEGDERGRCQSCVVLGRLGKDAREAIPTIATALTDASTRVQRDAAEALGLIGPESLPFLIEGLQKGDKVTSGGCAAALRKLGRAAEPALPALVEALTDESGKASCIALDALHQVSPEPARVVAANLLKIKNREVQEEAAIALAKLDPAAAAPFVGILIGRLASPLDPKNPWDRELKKRDGISTLSRMGPHAIEAVPALIDILMKGEGEDPGFAVRALYRIAPEDPRVLAAFEAALLGRNASAIGALRSLAEAAAQGE